MKLGLRHISLLIIFSIFISCNGQGHTEKRSLKFEEVSEAHKITIPKNGFSNGYVDKNGTFWFSSNAGGVYHYDGKNSKSYLTKIGRKQEDNLYHNWIPFIRKDNIGNMWSASMTHGVNRFDIKHEEPEKLAKILNAFFMKHRN